MRQYIVDAFTDKVFCGNPAAVCIMERWPSDILMQKIAVENRLSETAFSVKEETGYRLRWFTPGGEIDLCGHATLASAYVIMNFIEKNKTRLVFETMSGELAVMRRGELYEMDFPAYTLMPTVVTEEMKAALGASPSEAYLGRDLLCVFESEETVRQLTPDMEKVKTLPGLLLHATAPSASTVLQKAAQTETEKTDCVSRSFAPKLSIPEDPVCGSGHCHIIPYWVKKLGKRSLIAYQASERGGTLYCRLEGGRVKLSGKAVLYAVSEINAGF